VGSKKTYAGAVTDTKQRVSETVHRRSPAVRWVTPLAAAVLVALAAAVVSVFYPLPVVLGTQPVPLFLALGLGAALAVIALQTEPAARKPRLGMSRRELAGLLAWWAGVLLATGILWYGTYKAWSALTLFIAIGLIVKILQVASHFESRVGFRIWMPFVAIILAFVALVGFGLVWGRTNLPPPIVAALDAYGPVEPSLTPPTRSAPDLSSINAQLQQSGDIDLGGMKTTKFTYVFHGSGVDVYLADIGFPAPRGSFGAENPPGWWGEVDGTSLRAGPKGTNFLVVAWDTTVADRFAAALTQELSS